MDSLGIVGRYSQVKSYSLISSFSSHEDLIKAPRPLSRRGTFLTSSRIINQLTASVTSSFLSISLVIATGDHMFMLKEHRTSSEPLIFNL